MTRSSTFPILSESRAGSKLLFGRISFTRTGSHFARKCSNQRGITLVETLVALAIMGLVTTTILVLVGQNTRFTASAQDRTYASIAADNLMVRALALAGPIETGQEVGEVEIAARQWRYRRIVTQTGVSGIFRIDIQIIAGAEESEGEQTIAHITTLREVK